MLGTRTTAETRNILLGYKTLLPAKSPVFLSVTTAHGHSVGLYRHFPAAWIVSMCEPGHTQCPLPGQVHSAALPPTSQPSSGSQGQCGGSMWSHGEALCLGCSLFGMLTIMPAALGAKGARFPEQWKAVLPKKDLPLTLHDCQASHSHSCQ